MPYSGFSRQIGTPRDGKETLWIDATIHAREWIAPAVAQYFIERVYGLHYEAESTYCEILHVHCFSYKAHMIDSRQSLTLQQSLFSFARSREHAPSQKILTQPRI